MARWLVVCCFFLSWSSVWAADTSPGTYAGELLKQVSKANPQLLGATIYAVPPKGGGAAVVVASTEGLSSGAPADPADLSALKAGTSSTIDTRGTRMAVRMQLLDVSGDPAGVLRLQFAYRSNEDGERIGHSAAQIRDWLRRRVSHTGNLFDPVPYERDAPATDTYAQQLVDEFIGKYPEIEIFVIHATPPESDYNVIAGSNIGRIGKKADNDDMRCIFTGKPNLEVNSTGKRFESEMPLHDRAGQVIGALGVVVAYKKEDDKQALFKHADQIRAALEKKIPDAGSLFRPAPQGSGSASGAGT